MNIPLVDLKQRYDSTSVSVIKELLEHPDFSSQRIAQRLGLSREELLECYDIIQSHKELQHVIIENSKSPRLTKTASDLITVHKDYLIRILSGKQIYPLILEFHPGPICQCQCKFCFSSGYDYGEYTKREKPISMDRVLEIFDECRQNGVKEIWFSGGKEPLTNPLTLQYLRSANEMGFKTRLYTNGISMNKQVQEAILDCQHIRISIDGAKPATYNRIHFPRKSGGQITGVFNRILANISNLVSLKKEKNKRVEIGIGLILQPDNYDEMVDFANLGRRLGVDSIHFRLETIGMVRRFTPHERKTIRSEIVELTGSNYGIELDIRGVAEGEFESGSTEFLPGLRRPALCRAGLLKRGLNPYGDVYYCEFSSHPRFQMESAHLRLGNINQEDLGDILRSNMGKYPPACPLCQAHEYGLNITLEKMENDLKYGILIERQPYYRKHDDT